MNQGLRSSILFLIFIFLIAGCDPSRVYEDHNDFHEAFWHVDSVQTFTFEIDDSDKAYNLYSTIRNSTIYSFHNLFFEYTIRDSVGEVLLKELKEVNLFDPVNGRPFGSGLGDLFDHRFLLEEAYQFDTVGHYSISFQQFMRLDTLPFILSVGARVEITEE